MRRKQPSKVGGWYAIVACVTTLVLIVQPLLGVMGSPTLAQAAAPALDVRPQASSPSYETLRNNRGTPPAQPHTAAVPRATEPASMDRPITLSRVQSRAVADPADETVVITFTVTNNRSPLDVPDVPPGATVTDTHDIVAGFDFGADPNTVRNVLLTTSLTPDAMYADAEPVPDSDAGTNAWNLGDISPGSSVTAVFTVTAPTAVADFTELDTGATAYGTLQGRAVSAAAAPAHLVPDSFAQWLIRTVDADTRDEEMLAKAGDLGQDPAAVFAYVRGLGYESYSGSLRGTRGTLWSGAGNSIDQASLLIAMLRASGVPARYRHSTLSTANAQLLIDSMFPNTPKTIGHVPAGAEVSDPRNDSDVLAETTDHWWVEAYLPGQGWVDLDPSFPTAAIGDSFAESVATDGTDRIAELPDTLRHKVTIALEVETYQTFNLVGGLETSTPLSTTLNVVELTGKPVSLSHLVTSDVEGGLVYTNVTHTYSPYLLIGDEELYGTSYQDLFTSFPLGTVFHSAAWLHFTLHDVDGTSETFERELVDYIGAEARQNGGTVEVDIPAGNPAMFSEFDVYTTWFWPNLVPASALEQAQAEALGDVEAINADLVRLDELQAAGLDTPTPAEEEELRQIRARFQANAAAFLGNVGLAFGEVADRGLKQIGDGLHVKAYYDAPRIVTVASDVTTDTTSFTMDLRRTAVRTIAYPGQPITATAGFNVAKGIVESGIEGHVLEQSVGQPIATTARLFEAATEQDIDSVLVDAGNLYTLDNLSISEPAKARITAAVHDGKIVIAPENSVLLDGEPQTGWWEITPETGETIGVMENGLHSALIEYVFDISLFGLGGPTTDYILGFTTYTLGFVASRVDKAIGPGTFDQEAYTEHVKTTGTRITCVAILTGLYSALSCGGAMDFFGKGEKAAKDFFDSIGGGDPPFPSNLMTHVRPDRTRSEITGTATVPASLSAGALSASLAAPFATVTGTVDATWEVAGTNGVTAGSFTVSSGTLYDDAGTMLGSGTITGDAGTMRIKPPAYMALDGTGHASFHAPATSGLGAGTRWSGYVAQITDTSSVTLTLDDAAVTHNGMSYDGDFTIVSDGTVDVSGAGSTGAPNFTTDSTATLQDATILIGNASGSASVGGTPLHVTNGLAVVGYAGSLSVAEADTSSDQFDLTGSGDAATLHLSPAASTTDPVTSVTFQADVAATFDDTYTLTVEAPDGWDLSIDGTQVTATPPLGTTPADYEVMVTARSSAYPDLFLTAVHTVTVNSYDGLQLSVAPDSIFTVPMGPVLNENVPASNTNTGQMQVPGAAYTINVTNTATLTRTVDVTVSGLPAGWTLLSTSDDTTAGLTLPPGEAGQLGLYVTPDTPPAADSNYPFTVDASSDSGKTASDTATFTMPALPFSYVDVEPPIVYATPNSTTTFDLTLQNVGTAAGDLPLSINSSIDAIAPASPPTSPVTLDPGESDMQSVTLDVGNLPIGTVYPVHIVSPAPGTVYTQTENVLVRMVSAASAPLFAASTATATTCRLDPTGLPAALEELALAVSELEQRCEDGGCDLAVRDQVVDALDSAAEYADWASPLVESGDTLRAIGDDMAGHTDSADLNADITALSSAVSTLETEICELYEHRPAASFTPPVDAVLGGRSITYTLEIENQGAVTTTYAVTASLPAGPIMFTETIAAGAATSRDVVLSPSSLGIYNVTADVVATGDDVGIDHAQAEATARLNVVDRFVQMTDVIADPAYVETGSSVTNLRAAVTNVANVRRDSTAHVEVLAPTGAISYTDDVSLTVLAGLPRTYDLTTVDTSGWAEGIYTASVALRDDAGALIPDGSGYGYFSVGQGLAISQTVSPEIVAPGTVTVTTAITTRILADVIDTLTSTTNADSSSASTTAQTTDTLSVEVASDSDAMSSAGANVLQAPLAAGTAISRSEEIDAVWTYTGSWSAVSINRASGGQVNRSTTAGDTAAYTFNGNWVGIGFVAGDRSGMAEIFIDGISQETVDLYRTEGDIVSRYYGGMISSTHTISVTVLGTANPYSLGTNVNLDFVDTWNGSSLPTGTFEAEDGPNDRIFLSAGWLTRTGSNASGGSYIRSGGSTAWFAFTGDTVSFQAFNFSGGDVKLYVDGVYQTLFALDTTDGPTATISFDSLGSGPHVLQVSSYRGLGGVDAFTTPGSAPFYTPPAPTGVTRYEDDDPALLYNGVPYTQTATSWNRVANINAFHASSGQYIHSGTAGDTVSLTFSGPWVGVGFAAGRFGGEAKIFIDGVSQGVVDTYRRDGGVVSVYYDNLINTTHTISATVLGTAHPNSSGTAIYMDYVDVWDGTPLSMGVFEEGDEHVYRSANWGSHVSAAASGGTYLQDGIYGTATAWHAFGGDSVSYQAMAHGGGGRVRVSIDGEHKATVNLYNPTAVTRTWSFDGLGAGAHVITVQKYRGEAMIDAFVTPGSAPFYTPPVRTGLVRYEEDDPELRYNGETYEQRPQSWNQTSTRYLSGEYAVSSGAAGNVVSLTFDGAWAGVGFATRSNYGQAEVFIDGVSQGIVDTATANEDVMEVVYDGLISATHTISVSVVGNGAVVVDFIDAWDGTEMPDGWVDADLLHDEGRLFFSTYWKPVDDDYAFGGDYLGPPLPNVPANAWFLFTGDAVTYLTQSRHNGGQTEVVIDGVSQGVVDLTTDFSNKPLSLHYDGLGDGPHVVQVHYDVQGRVDAFESDPADLSQYVPHVEWWDAAPAAMTDTYGILSTIAAGDLDGDGTVELVAPSNNGALYTYRGDGMDAGGGSPLLWSKTIGATNEPAIADLDLDGDGEIVTIGQDGMYALQHDGSTIWYTDTITSADFDSMNAFGWGGPSVGNLDLDPEPEIVVAAHDTCVCVLDSDGTLLWETPIGPRPTIPVLADITEDGVLDIIVAQDHTLTVYDYAAGGAIAMQRTITDSSVLNESFGAPAVVDIDGHLPGGDAGPEIVKNWGRWVEAIDADGTVLWTYYVGNTNFRYPSQVAVADTDGDGEVEIVGASAIQGFPLVLDHTLFVLNADGSELWRQNVGDKSASASGVSVHDLDGDGVWEVVWNGSQQGLTIFRGADGTTLFNEPYINSGTIVDYPTVADVDGDGYAEILAGDQEGLYVIGHDWHWAPARPLWNSHDYHITNVNDDLSVPVNEQPSWEIHNTYRTQTPLTNPMPVYSVELTHTVGLTDVTVLTDTFSTPAGVISGTDAYHWSYRQEWYQPTVTRTFQSRLTNVQPGQVRQVNRSTEVVYTLATGTNRLTLPPRYVSAPHIISVAPVSQTVGAGSTAVYSVTLSNPAATGDTYTLSVAGLPAEWVTHPPTVTLGAGTSTTVGLTVSVPADATPETTDFAIDATNGAGGRDQARASLTVVDALDIAIAPTESTVATGSPAAYALSVTNKETVTRTYALTATGTAAVSVPSEVTVGANSTATTTVTAMASAPGRQPFTVEATASATGARDRATSVLAAIGRHDLGLTLAPAHGVGGPATPISYTLGVNNLGTVSDTYDLAVTLPAGWTYALSANGTEVGSVGLAPHVFNTANLHLLVTPPASTAAGSYTVSATATSRTTPETSAVVTGTAQVLDRGVTVQIAPDSTMLTPTEMGQWDVIVTNTGATADTFELTAPGILGLSAQFSSDSVSLGAGASQTVQLTTTDTDFVLPGTYDLAVAAQSQADSRIRNEDRAAVTIAGYESVAVGWEPAAQTVTDTLRATYILVMTNTANVPTDYTLALDGAGLSASAPVTVMTLLPHSSARLPVQLTADGPGTYNIDATAASAGGSDDTDTATLMVVSTGEPLTVDAGADHTTDEGTVVSFGATTNDQNTDSLTIEWDFGDGGGTTGTLTPSHTYADDGSFTATVTITDSAGLSATDTALITVHNVSPTVAAGSDQTVFPTETVSLAPATFTDPGAADTHTATIDWGDGTVVSGTVGSGTVAGSHIYETTGTYFVTVTVLDDDGGAGSDTFTVNVSDEQQGRWTMLLPLVLNTGDEEADWRILLPLVLKEP